MKLHTVELGRYFSHEGLELIRQEVAAGLTAVQLPFAPRWITHPDRLAVAAKSGTHQHSSIKITVRTNDEAQRILKQGIHFGDKFHRAGPYMPVGPDTIFTVCCYCGHMKFHCPDPDRMRCAICAEAYVTSAHKFPISGYKTTEGKYCKAYGSYKCAKYAGNRTARASKFSDHRRITAAARADRAEWREQERNKEEKKSAP